MRKITYQLKHASLNSEVQVFIQKTLVSLEEMYNKKGDDMKPIVRATSKCVEACYSFDEMHETLSARFGQPLRTTQKMYDFYFTGKKGCKAYKQLSLVRAAQRRAEKLQSQKQQQLNVDHKNNIEQEQAGENQVHEQAREDQVPEEKEQQAREDQVPEENEQAGEVRVPEKQEQAGEDQVTEQNEKAESLEVEDPIQDEDEVNTEHNEQVYSESSVLPILKQINIEQEQEQAGENQLPEQKEEAESLEVELPIQDENEVNNEHKEQAYSEPSVLPILKQLINSQKEILDAMTSQKKMMEALMDLLTKIAKKDELESLRSESI
ncbi:Uncharacterized protein Rs2_02605 [Raphanus sativus]|nr:Uncharacterized protein Rs2_02605 [Raphanus sativus]